MKSRDTKAGGQRKMLLSGATLFAAAAAAGFATPVLAQDADPGADEEIVVTGSRIARPNLTSPTAVTSINAEAIEQSGLTNMADVLRTVPSFGVSGLSTTNSNFLTSSFGVNTLNLRNLGEDRTLVLVDGRRFVSGVPGSAAVDFNNLPVQMIERVEVITGGASAIYGSDALAGVVNVILKDDFEGVQVGYQYGVTEENDNRNHTPYALMGTNFADDRGNVTVLLGFDQSSGVRAADRANTAVDGTALCAFTGDDADCDEEVTPTFSSYSAFGRFEILSTGETFTVSNGAGPGGTVSPFATGVYGFNRQPFRAIAVPIERFQFSANSHYDITDSLTAYAQATFTRAESRSTIEPFPLDYEDIFPVGGLSIDNPFVPQEIRDAAILAGDDVIGFRRRIVELGDRGGIGQRDTYRFVFGLRGELNEDVDWDAYYANGETRQAERTGGQVNIANFRESLNAEDLDGDPATTFDIQCADPIARLEGCVPINIFGLGSISPEAANYVIAPGSRISSVRQEVAGASLTGTAFELPAGPLSFALGAEWRREGTEDVPDALTQAGGNGGNEQPATYGGYDVAELFGEVDVPLLTEQPLAHDLSIGAAYRYSDYSTVGTTEAYSGHVSWAPIEALRFRGQWARAVRAPNIGELFSPGGEDFETVVDPCNGVTATSVGNIDDNCRSIPSIAARIAGDPGDEFVLTLAETQGTGGFTGVGDPNLTPEVSDSWSVGVVFNPNIGGGRDLLFSIDYYNIDITNLIHSIDRQDVLDLCFDVPTADFATNPFCNFLVRDETGPAFEIGELTEVNTPAINDGGIFTEGFDVSAAFSTPIGAWGDIALRANYTYLVDFTLTSFDAPTEFLGDVGYAEHKLQGAAVLMHGPWSLTWETTYLSEAEIAADLFVDSYMLHDMQLSLDLHEGASQLYFGVNNVLNEEAPNIFTALPDNTTGTDTAADVYDAIGRSFYTGIRVNF